MRGYADFLRCRRRFDTVSTGHPAQTKDSGSGWQLLPPHLAEDMSRTSSLPAALACSITNSTKSSGMFNCRETIPAVIPKPRA